MESHLFWFNDEQWAMIAPHLPTSQPGPERKDDRLILNGIMHVLKVGCRWVDCPKGYGRPCHGGSGLLSLRGFGSQGDDKNQLQRVPVST